MHFLTNMYVLIIVPFYDKCCIFLLYFCGRKINKFFHFLGQKYNQLKQQYEIKSHELGLIRERLKTTRHHQLAQEVEEMQAQNAQLDKDLKEAKLLQSQGDNKMKELEYKIKNAKALKV